MTHPNSAPAHSAGAPVATESFPVTDPILRLMVLTQLAGAPKAPQAPQAPPREDSVLEGAIARIRAMPFSDLVRLAQAERSPSIAISVNLEQLANEVNRYEFAQAATAMYEYFVRAEASISMMIELFKTTATAVKVTQASLGVTPRVGRRAAPDEDTRLEIIDAWQGLAKVHPYMRERYYRLHQLFSQFTLAELDGVINTWATQNHPRRPIHS